MGMAAAESQPLENGAVKKTLGDERREIEKPSRTLNVTENTAT
jgi:hypothetical protein